MPRQPSLQRLFFAADLERLAGLVPLTAGILRELTSIPLLPDLNLMNCSHDHESIITKKKRG